MKIAIIIQDITKSNGTEHAVCNLANQLTEFGNHKVSIISNDSIEGKAFFELNSKVSVIHLGLNISKARKVNKLIEYFKLYNRLKRYVISENIESIIGTYYSLNIIISFLSSKIAKIGCEHLTYSAAGTVQKKLRMIFYKFLNAVVILTNSDAKNYHFLKKERLFVIPNSISFECNSFATCENKRIIAVGRLEDVKGFDMLIDIAAIIKNEMPDWHIEIFGEGSRHQLLDEKILNNNLGDFIFLKGFSGNVKSELLNSSIFVCTSRHEGFPLVLLEAQSCGLPIISFACPEGPREIVKDGENGFLIPPNDLNMFADKLLDLANDINLRRQFSFHAIKNAKEYSPEVIFNKWQMLLNDITYKRNGEKI